jgi:hypothetical protein
VLDYIEHPRGVIFNIATNNKINRLKKESNAGQNYIGLHGMQATQL